MAHDTRQLARTEVALIVLFCLLDGAYATLNPKGQRYESLKGLSDTEVLTHRQLSPSDASQVP